MNKKSTKQVVREAYGKIAQGSGCGCGSSCCGPDTATLSKSIGYTDEDLKKSPGEANLSLGCGNPTAIASLKPGEMVLDLGSGAGFDCFLAAEQVGPKGKVIGVDMTPEMVEKARDIARQRGIKNVEFRLGEIEALPVADASVDVVLSNCVINLSTDKPQVFREVHRVLKPGGRIAVSDLALTKELPPKVRESVAAYVGCVGGALLVKDYEQAVKDSGLKGVKLTVKSLSNCIDSATKDPLARSILDSLGGAGELSQYVVSVYVEGRKG
jgi:SAM-dependent methyltransferase